MNAAVPKATREALLVTARAMLAPFAPACVIDRAVDAMLAALENGDSTASRKPQDRLLSAREVGQILGRTPKTVRSLARRGLIRAVHLGQGARAGGYVESSIRKFLAGANGSGEVRHV